MSGSAYTPLMRFARACLFGLALLPFSAWGGGGEVLPATRGGLPGPVISLQIDRAIGPASADHLHRALALASRQQAQLVVLRIDTPGGLDASMRTIIKDILASPVPVADLRGARMVRARQCRHLHPLRQPCRGHVAGVPTSAPRRRSRSACRPGGDPSRHRPSAQASAAQASGRDAMSAKRVGDAAAYIRSLAQLRGRNADWARKGVREAVSLSAARSADACKVIDLVASDLPDLLRQLDGRETQTRAARHGAPGDARRGRARLRTRLAHPGAARSSPTRAWP